MKQPSLMQQLLNKHWDELPPALQAHYQHSNNIDKGEMDIEYPKFMQLQLNFMRLFGALINRQGKAIPTTVEKNMQGNTQYWTRTVTFPDGKVVLFKSHWVYTEGNELIEYINSFSGLRMALSVKNNQLHYEGKSYVLKLGQWKINIPEWLVLGHTSIVEKALDEHRFSMDFRLTHPILGRVFRYSGTFSTQETGANI